jgi:hypothetical protein
MVFLAPFSVPYFRQRNGEKFNEIRVWYFHHFRNCCTAGHALLAFGGADLGVSPAWALICWEELRGICDIIGLFHRGKFIYSWQVPGSALPALYTRNMMKPQLSEVSKSRPMECAVQGGSTPNHRLCAAELVWVWTRPRGVAISPGETQRVHNIDCLL